MTERLRAYTLVEILLVMVLSSLLIYIVYQGLESIQLFLTTDRKKSDQVSAQRRLDYILYSEVNRAQEMTFDSSTLNVVSIEGDISSLFFGESGVIFSREDYRDTIPLGASVVSLESKSGQRRQCLVISVVTESSTREYAYFSRINSLPYTWD